MSVSADHDSRNGHHLILGGCGFIGRHVALKLARLGHRVIVADRAVPPCEFPADVRARIAWTPVNLAAADWKSLIAGATTIHHPAGDLSDNVVPTIALVEAIQRSTNRPRLIFASSGGTVYGKL